MDSNRTLIITGMHRCGTSFTASWLQKSGLFIGDRLAGATPSNIKGHFEDIDFLEFHERLLKANDETMYMNEEKQLVVSPEFAAEAHELCQLRNERHSEWGFKQPRATLFLDFWGKTIHEVKFIFLFRNPLAVINSIVRRESNKLLYRNEPGAGARKRLEYLDDVAQHAQKYGDMYALHCQRVWSFIENADHNDFLLLDFDRIMIMEDILNRKLSSWNFQFDLVPYEELYQAKLLISNEEYLVKTELIPEEAADMHIQLKDLSERLL